jgi:hypothetical protein
MDNSVVYKPVFWRLFVIKFFPFYIGWTGFGVVYRLKNHYPMSFLISFLIITTLTILIMALLTVYFTRKKFEITIDKDNISGIGTGYGFPTETFPISDLDFSYRDKQSFYEKISFFHTIRSLSGQKIMVMDFIYGKPVTKELYQILEKYHSQSSKL